MNETIRIELDVAPETAAALSDDRRRAAAGRLVDIMVQPGADDPLIAALNATRAAARSAGLTDAEIDAELAAHKAERRR